MPQMIQESVEQVSLARQVGFDLISTGQHYLATPYQMSTSFPLLARLAAEAGDMEVPIAGTYPLAEATEALRLIEDEAAKGKAFSSGGDFGMIKRLRPSREGVTILSDNPAVPDDFAVDDELRIIGRAIAKGGKL